MGRFYPGTATTTAWTNSLSSRIAENTTPSSPTILGPVSITTLNLTTPWTFVSNTAAHNNTTWPETACPVSVDITTAGSNISYNNTFTAHRRSADLSGGFARYLNDANRTAGTGIFTAVAYFTSPQGSASTDRAGLQLAFTTSSTMSQNSVAVSVNDLDTYFENSSWSGGVVESSTINKAGAEVRSLAVSEASSVVKSSVQIARPDGTGTVVGTWTGSHLDVDEATPNDADYISSSTNPAVEDYYTVTLSSLQGPLPGNHTIRFRYAKDASAGKDIALDVQLRQGDGTIIHSENIGIMTSATYTQREYTLTPQEVALITDYEDLRFRFIPTASGGGAGRAARLSWLEFEVPEAAPVIPKSASDTCSFGISSDTGAKKEISSLTQFADTFTTFDTNVWTVTSGPTPEASNGNLIVGPDAGNQINSLWTSDVFMPGSIIFDVAQIPRSPANSSMMTLGVFPSGWGGPTGFSFAEGLGFNFNGSAYTQFHPTTTRYLRVDVTEADATNWAISGSYSPDSLSWTSIGTPATVPKSYLPKPYILVRSIDSILTQKLILRGINEVVAQPASLTDFSETFDTLDTTNVWTISAGTASASAGKLVLGDTSGASVNHTVVSKDTFWLGDLIFDISQMPTDNLGDGRASFGVMPSGTSLVYGVGYSQIDNTLFGTGGSISYNPSTMRYIKVTISEQNTTTYLITSAYSSDASTWTNFGTGLAVGKGNGLLRPAVTARAALNNTMVNLLHVESINVIATPIAGSDTGSLTITESSSVSINANISASDSIAIWLIREAVPITFPSDDFSTKDTVRWNYDAAATVSGGQVSIPATTAYPGVYLNAQYTMLEGDVVQVKMVRAPRANTAQQGIFRIAPMVGDYARCELIVENGNLIGRYNPGSGGSDSNVSIAAPALDNLYLRFRMVSDKISYEYSLDGSNWTVLRNDIWAYQTTNLNQRAFLVGGQWTTAGGTDSVIFDDFNISSTIIQKSASDTAAVSVAEGASVVSQTPGLVTETASLRTLIENQYSATLDEGTETYDVPTTQNLSDFQSIWNNIMSDNLSAAATVANGYGYEVVDFTDTETSRQFYVLREQISGGTVARGWGTYVWAPNSTSRSIYEVPHVKADLYTELQGVDTLIKENAKGLLMAGAHRNTNAQLIGSDNVSDVANVTDPPSSIFQYIHQIADNMSDRYILQYHGFADGNAEPTGGALFRAGSEATTGDVTQTSLTINTPTDIQVGDYMFAVVAVRDSTNVITDPAGWTRVNPSGSNANGSVNDGTLLQSVLYQRVVDGTEAASYMWSWTIDSRAVIQMVAYEGVAGIDAAAAGIETASSVTSHTTPTVISTNSNSIPVYMIYGASNSTYSTPNISGDFRRFQTNTGPTTSVNGGWFDSGFPETAGSHNKEFVSSLPFSTATMYTIYLRPTNVPEPTDIVISRGGIDVPAKDYQLADTLRAAGYTVRVNEGGFELTASDNVQGIYSRTGTSDWVHLEQSTTVRSNATSREEIATIIANFNKSGATTAVGSESTAIAATETSSLFKQISATDTSALSLSEVVSVHKGLPGTESISIGVAEQTTIFVTRGTTDTGAVAASDTSSLLVSAPKTATETASLTVADTAALQRGMVASESNSLAVAETASLFKAIVATETNSLASAEVAMPQKGIPGQESAAVGIAESVAVYSTGVASDTGSVAIAEAAITVVSQARTDTAAIVVSETTSGSVTAAGTETNSIAVNDIAGFTSSTLSLETTSLAVTETSTIAVAVTASETNALAVAESRAIPAAVTRTDTASIATSETSSLFKTMVAADTSGIAATDVGNAEKRLPGTETIPLAVAESAVAASAGTATDSGSVSASEASSVFVSQPVSDNASLTTTESSSGFVTAIAIDTGSLAVSENRNIASTLPGTETVSISVTEQSATASAGVNTDTLSIGATETRTTAVTQPAADTTGLAVTETTSAFKTFTASDTLSIGTVDISNTEKGFPGQDTVTLAVAETSSTHSTGVASDSSSIAVSETRTILVTQNRVDNPSLAVAEATEGTVTAVASDNLTFSMIDSISTGGELLGTDSATLNVSETTQTFATTPASDNLATVVSETAVVEISSIATEATTIAVGETVEVATRSTASDALAVVVTEESSLYSDITVTATEQIFISVDDEAGFDTVDITASDAVSMTVAETTEFARDIRQTDVLHMTVVETSAPFANFPGSDTGSVAVSETSSVTVSGDIIVSAVDAAAFTVLEEAAPQTESTVTDTASIAVAETSTLEISGTNNLGASDSGSLAVSETTAFEYSVEASDDIALDADETADGFITAVAADAAGVSVSELHSSYLETETTESLSITVVESASPFTNFPGQDTGSLALTETSELAYLGTFVNSDSDTASLSVSETTSTTVEIVAVDSTSLAVSEVTSGDVLAVAADTPRIGLSEGHQSLRGIPVEDTLGLNVSESTAFETVVRESTDTFSLGVVDVALPNTSFPGTDAGTLMLAETAQVVVSGTLVFAGEDSATVSLTESVEFATIPTSAAETVALRVTETRILGGTREETLTDTLTFGMTDSSSLLAQEGFFTKFTSDSLTFSLNERRHRFKFGPKTPIRFASGADPGIIMNSGGGTNIRFGGSVEGDIGFA